MNIDIHAHLMPPSAREAAASGGTWFGSTFEFGDTGNPVLVTQGRRRPLGRPEHMQDMAARVAAMDAIGVDIQVLSLVPPLFGYDLDRADVIALARQVNDEIAGYIEAHPTRFRGMATVAATDTDAAIAELERCMALPGFVGVELGTHVQGADWDDDRLLPILEAAERLGAIVFLHPNDPRGGAMMPRFFLRNLVGNPLETTVAVSNLILSGAIDRLPELRIFLAHGGGYVGMAAGRLDHGRKVRAENQNGCTHLPSEYLRRFYPDALVFAPGAVRFLVDTYGSDRVVMGSDYPADMGPEDPVTELTSNTLLSEEERAAILGGNLMRELSIREGGA
ncbi:MAG: hypothetical protein RLZZ272_1654 [Actinomycetota bacterium]